MTTTRTHHTADSLYIGGEWVPPTSTTRITVVSPNTGETIADVPGAGPADIDAAVTAARQALDGPDGWRERTPQDRATVLRRFADLIDRRKDEFARLVSAQNGMPIRFVSQLEAVYPATLLRYYAGLIEEQGEDIRDGLFGGTVEVRREPIGVVAAVVPWNFPQTLAFMKIAPALATGCTVVVKPSPETVLDSFLLAQTAIDAGLPPGVLNIAPGGRETGAYLVGHPDIDKVAFTGSTAAGVAIAETCGRLLRPVTLELGGKSAAIVLDDAELDLDAVGAELLIATLANNGQTCFLGTRILAPRHRYAEIVDTFTEFAASMTVGDSLDPGTEIGPMATAHQRDRVEGYIAQGRAEGGRITTGGGRPEGLDRGWFVEPTVFAGVDNNATVSRKEIFGPVLTVIPYTDEEDAVRIANDSRYGLGGTVWSADPERALRLARRVRTGTIGVNRYLPDPVAPFGGVKASGLGRELGPEGMAAFQQLTSVYR